MFVLAYDTETTGLPNWKAPSGDPSQPHLVQIAALVANIETRQVIASLDLIDKTGLAYIHSSGCAVLQNGAWLQPEQRDVWLQHLNEGEKEEC